MFSALSSVEQSSEIENQTKKRENMKNNNLNKNIKNKNGTVKKKEKNISCTSFESIFSRRKNLEAAFAVAAFCPIRSRSFVIWALTGERTDGHSAIFFLHSFM